MIETQADRVIAYLDENGDPATPEQATRAYVLYNDGGSEVVVKATKDAGAPVKLGLFNPRFKFDPEQPRDAHGQWTSEGGGDAGGSGSSGAGQPIPPGVNREIYLAASKGLWKDGKPNIPSADNLTPEERAVEEHFKAQIAGNVDGALKEYAALKMKHADSEGGKIINTDIARELDSQYRNDRSLSAAVHEPASWLMKEKYARDLAKLPGPGEKPLVVFSAGGTGAGKSSGLDMDPQLKRDAQMIYDTNLNDTGKAIGKIDQALAAGKAVEIVYTYRDPIEALTGGALPRATRMEQDQGSGRTVPVNEHIGSHLGSRTAIDELAAHYGNRVKIRAIDNSRGRNQAKPVALKSLPKPKLGYNALYEEAIQKLDEARAAGSISERVYNGFRGGGTRGPHGAKHGGFAQQARLPGADGRGGAVRGDAGAGREAPGLAGRDRQAHRRPTLTLDFDPNEPRDEHGRWTSGGGSGAGNGAAAGHHALYDTMLSRLNERGGFSVEPATGKEPTTGYVLSVYPERSVGTDAGMTFEQFDEYLHRNQDLLAKPDHYFGGWKQTDTGRVFLDVSVVKSDRNEAESLARKHDQIAIYDLGSGKEITVNPQATSGGAAKHDRPDRPIDFAQGRRLADHRRDGSGLREAHGAQADPGRDRSRTSPHGATQDDGLTFVSFVEHIPPN